MKSKTLGKKDLSQRGFALVVTLSLMILLSVIAVGLLSLSGVALRSSSQGQAAAEARANARLALMMAIGELQKEMGPDSRISAPHDAGTAATGGQPHWTAVYDAWKRPTDPNTPESPQSRTPTFRSWLVSGSTANTGNIANLVGSGSLGNSPVAADYIDLPVQAVNVGKQKGGFAWWAADESRKAKVNAGPDSSVATNPLFGSQSVPHVGHQAFEILKSFEWKPGQRSIAIDNGGVDLAAGLGSRGIGNLNHGITTQSAGVLCDVREGRLKRDLSQLLARPVETIEDMPLYLADGRVNRFQIGDKGTIANSSIVSGSTSAPNTASEWGVNLEELHLFHNIHRELKWSGGRPTLAMRSTREQAVKDRYYLYKRPVIDAVQFILSLKAESTGGGNYRMVMMLDGMVALSNPNDVSVTWPPGLIFPIQLQNIPYNLQWNIKDADDNLKNDNTASSADFGLFVGRIGGGTSGQSSGFTLEPGEAGVFGSTSGNGPQLDLMRGFLPSGGVRINPSASNGWDLKAAGLKGDYKIDFTLTKGDKGYKGGYTYYNAWIGDRRTGSNAKGWQIDSLNLGSSGDINSEFMNRLLISPIRPSESRPVSDFVTKPQPIMMISFLRNVERDSGNQPPDAFASRQLHLNEAVNAFRGMTPSSMEAGMQLTQYLITSEPLNYQFRTLAAGAGGRNVYQGGGRQPSLGGSFNVIRRRVPIAPPLSLGSFENAIASGFSSRMKDAPNITNDEYPSDAMALSGQRGASYTPAKVIGNSWATPFVPQDVIYKPSSGGSPATRAATDHSWMANTALWDTWFLSSIVDGRGLGGNSFQQDNRSPRKQFEDLATSVGDLRNTRFVFHPHRSADEAIKELFDGEVFKESSLNNLSKYLLVDGAFNVNSTSENAWKALLSSVRDQELLLSGGQKKKFDYPYGTLGYAHDESTENDWTGLRNLSDSDIDALGKAIAKEVKERGPFLSLADFVNRRPNASNPKHQVLGALQAAIDEADLNKRFVGGGRSVTSADFSALAGGGAIDAESAPARALGSAGHLTQAKLLTAIGAQITVRSDTFVIRAYGDSRDAAGKVAAKAWCEALVQRVPEYLDPADRPEAQDGWPQPGDKLSPVNSRFGRRWEIKSFRWLSSNEVLGA